jgi:hypothetical protein
MIPNVKYIVKFLLFKISQCSNSVLSKEVLSRTFRFKSLDTTVMVARFKLHSNVDERSIFWEFIGSVILRKKVHVNMCPILNGFQDRAI